MVLHQSGILHAQHLSCTILKQSSLRFVSGQFEAPRKTVLNMPHPDQNRWFEEEVQPHEPALRAYLQSRYPDMKDVDDLVQESYARLLKARRKGAISSVKAYLFAIARNATLSLFRRPRVFAEQSLDDHAVQSVAEEKHNVIKFVSTKQEVEILLEAIESLPKRCREIFILTKLNGCTHQETADQLGISVQTVHVQVVRGLQKCTLFLRKKGVLGN